MTYSTVKYGSRGDQVRELQEILNQQGYGLTADGIFGAKTQAAVKDYQQKNNLSVDGIVGNNTWEALNGQRTNVSNTNAATDPNATTSKVAQYEANKPQYAQSDALKKAQETLSQYETNKPGEYKGAYTQQIDQLLDKVMNREEFQYDFNADPLYQQYKDQYIQQGRQAMLDTMGNAAALTGGYGNSYASTAGNQAYQAHLNQLNNVIPDLYNAAYDRYRDQGTDMTNKLGILQGLDNTDYGRYRDTVGDYYNDLNYYYGKANAMSSEEYNRYLNDLNAWQADRDYYYGKLQDEQAQKNWQTEFDYAKQQDALAATKSSGGGGRSSSSSSSKKSTGSFTTEDNRRFDSSLYRVDEGYGDYSTVAQEILNIGVKNNVSDSKITAKLKEYGDGVYKAAKEKFGWSA